MTNASAIAKFLAIPFNVSIYTVEAFVADWLQNGDMQDFTPSFSNTLDDDNISAANMQMCRRFDSDQYKLHELSTTTAGRCQANGLENKAGYNRCRRLRYHSRDCSRFAAGLRLSADLYFCQASIARAHSASAQPAPTRYLSSKANRDSAN